MPYYLLSGVARVLNKDKSSFYDLPLEKTDSTIQQVVEWFGEDYGLALINGEFWMVSVGSIDEGGNKWWFKIKINTDDLEIARLWDNIHLNPVPWPLRFYVIQSLDVANPSDIMSNKFQLGFSCFPGVKFLP